jgi:hypothetical protein
MAKFVNDFRIQGKKQDKSRINVVCGEALINDQLPLLFYYSIEPIAPGKELLVRLKWRWASACGALSHVLSFAD